MLLDLFKRNAISRFGYIKDQDGILSRYFREREGWDKHLNNCQSYIRESLKFFEHKTAVILGSGWLLDVPIEDLSKTFGKVFLVDIRHPKQIQHKAQKLGNVFLLQHDITGGLIEEIDALIRNKQIDTLDVFPVEKLRSSPKYFGLPNDIQADMTVSLNLLNQLDILICDHIKSKIQLSEKQLLPLRNFIQAEHIKHLPQGKTVLITDFEEHAISKEGQEYQSPLIYIDFPSGKSEKNWIWKFDYSGHYREKHKVYFCVKAIRY